jgi:hypothetical protein
MDNNKYQKIVKRTYQDLGIQKKNTMQIKRKTNSLKKNTMNEEVMS